MAEENYNQFIADAVSMGCIWGLQSEEGWAQCASEKYPNASVIPFWSQPEYAQQHQAGEWADYQVVPISLEEFLEDWLVGMHEDVVLAGINWNEDLEGIEHEPLDILHDFDHALSG